MTQTYTATFSTRTENYNKLNNNNGSLSNYYDDNGSYNNSNLNSYSNVNPYISNNSNSNSTYNRQPWSSRSKSSRNLVKSAIETTSVIGNRTIVNGILVNSEDDNPSNGAKFSFEVNYPQQYQRAAAEPSYQSRQYSQASRTLPRSEYQSPVSRSTDRSDPSSLEKYYVPADSQNHVRFNVNSSPSASQSDYRDYNSSRISRYNATYDRPKSRIGTNSLASDTLINSTRYGKNDYSSSYNRWNPASNILNNSTSNGNTSGYSSSYGGGNDKYSSNTGGSSTDRNRSGYGDKYNNLSLSKQYTTDSNEFTNTLADDELVKAQTVVVIDKDPSSNHINQIRETFRLSNSVDNLTYDQYSEYKSELNADNQPVINITESIKFNNIDGNSDGDRYRSKSISTPYRSRYNDNYNDGEKVSFRKKLLESSIESTSVINDTTTVVEAPFRNY